MLAPRPAGRCGPAQAIACAGRPVRWSPATRTKSAPKKRRTVQDTRVNVGVGSRPRRNRAVVAPTSAVQARFAPPRNAIETPAMQASVIQRSARGAPAGGGAPVSYTHLTLPTSDLV